MKYRVSVKFNKDFINVDDEKKLIEIGVKSKPIKGRANLEIMKKIGDYFSVPTSKVRLLAGARSKTKIVEIVDE